MNIELKKASANDFDFAFEVKKDAMGSHIKSKWGWDEDFQLSIHKQRWAEKPWFIILFDGEPVGTVSIADLEGQKRFGEFYIKGTFRNNGIGSSVLSQFLQECDQNSNSVVLEYLKWNPVGSLYKRHGFKVTGENEIHYFMARTPKAH
ncbi:GNAT family N-acetyltransferase [Aurantivibrio plasticivorans]